MAKLNLAQDGPKPSELQLAQQRELRQKIQDAVDYIDTVIAPSGSRPASLAKTALEEGLMWGGKAIFEQ